MIIHIVGYVKITLDLTKQASFVCRTIQGKIGSGKGVLVSKNKQNRIQIINFFF